MGAGLEQRGIEAASCADLFLDHEAFGDGTFAPFCLASLSPIAMACFRLVTFRPELLFNVPFLRRCMADFTVLDAALPYFAIVSTPSYVVGRSGNDRAAFNIVERRSRGYEASMVSELTAGFRSPDPMHP